MGIQYVCFQPVDFAHIGFQGGDPSFQVLFEKHDPVILDNAVGNLFGDGIIGQIRRGIFHLGFRQLPDDLPVTAAEHHKQSNAQRQQKNQKAKQSLDFSAHVNPSQEGYAAKIRNITVFSYGQMRFLP